MTGVVDGALTLRDGDLLLGVDVGNSKTAVVVSDAAGRVLAQGRGPGASPHAVGVAACLDVVQAALREAGAPERGYRAAALAVAGVDLPDEEEALHAAARERGLVPPPGPLSVVNDVFAVLRSATHEPRGVAVVVGAGINAVGLDDVGGAAGASRQARFLSLGRISGDWGGGQDLGELGLGAACRAADGRGPRTALTGAVLEHFGVRRVMDAVVAVHRDAVAPGAVVGFARRVLEAADAGDAVAGELVRRQAAEVAALVSAAAARVGVPLRELPVVLGGGVLHARTAALTGAVLADLAAAGADPALVRLTEVVPVVGSLLLAFDAVVAAGALPASARPAPAALAGQLAA